MQDQGVNPNEIVEEAKTVEDAIGKGLKRLGVSREQVDVEVLEEGTKGVFSLIGGKQAKVIVRRKDETGAVIEKVEELATNVLKLMEISSQVRIEVEDETYKIEVETAGADGLLIGKKGQNLEALTYLLKRMVGKQLRRSIRVEMDVGGYRRRREEMLRSKAALLAGRVKGSGKEVQMEPLPPAERRIVHLALQGDPMVRTYTIGEGDLKNVVVAPAVGDTRDRELTGTNGAE